MLTMMLFSLPVLSAVRPSGSELQYDNLLRLLASPAGIVGIALVGALIIGASASPVIKWLTVALLLYMSTVAFAVDPWFHNENLVPLPWIRILSRPVSGGLMLALLVPALIAPKGWRMQVVLASTLAFFGLEVALSLRLLLAGAMVRGVLGGAVFVSVFVIFGIGVSRWIQELPDALAAVRSILVAAMLFAAIATFELLVRPSAVLHGGRLLATTGNPQNCATVLASMLPAACYLVARKHEPKLWRLAAGLTTGLLVTFLIWTGSRTGVLMAVVGVVLLFRRHLGGLLMFLAVASLFTLVALNFFSESTDMLGRLVSTQNTRTGGWHYAWQVFLAHPLLGWMPAFGDNTIVESSYLAAAERMGVVGVALMALLVGSLLRTMARVNRSSRWLGDELLLADLVIAGIGSSLVGATFEGFLMGTITNQVYILYIYLGLAAFVLDCAVVNAAEAASGPSPEVHEASLEYATPVLN